ncbi:MAG: GAF and ANTAR domain-containing protein [Marmoricola sp.]
MNDGPLFSALQDLAAHTVDDGSLRTTAESVVAIALQTLECDYAGLTVFGPNGRLETMAPSDPIVEHADKLQYELEEGPCVAAAEDGTTYVCRDLATDPRWPRWGPVAAELGLGSLVGTRLVSGDHVLGALNLYCSRERDFAAADRDMAEVLAVHAATALIAVRERENLHAAMDARTLIGQAQGILMERFDIDAESAFGVLRRYSQTRNLKLRIVAEDVVATRRLPS